MVVILFGMKKLCCMYMLIFWMVVCWSRWMNWLRRWKFIWVSLKKLSSFRFWYIMFVGVILIFILLKSIRIVVFFIYWKLILLVRFCNWVEVVGVYMVCRIRGLVMMFVRELVCFRWRCMDIIMMNCMNGLKSWKLSCWFIDGLRKLLLICIFFIGKMIIRSFILIWIVNVWCRRILMLIFCFLLFGWYMVRIWRLVW